jgi:hypothetical protein
MTGLLPKPKRPDKLAKIASSFAIDATAQEEQWGTKLFEKALTLD